MKFRFRLEKVMGHKKIERDLAQRDFLDAQNKLNEGESKLKEMHDEIQNAKHLESESVQNGGKHAELLKWSAFFIEGQKLRIESQRKINRLLIQDVERKQDILVEKAREYKIFERLKEKMKERHKHSMKKADAKSIDEIVVMSAAYRKTS